MTLGLLNKMGAESARELPPRSADRHYMITTLAWTWMLYAVLLLAGWHAISLFWLVPVVPLIYVRLALALHELMHLRSAERVGAFHRLAMIFDTPLALGYREHRILHLMHHRWAASPRDPEISHIVGGHVRALLRAMVVPERASWLWLRRHGVRKPLRGPLVARLLGFMLMLWFSPAAFLVYWLMLRMSIGVSGFIFHHLLHQRDGRLGTYVLPAPPVLVRLGQLLFGREPVLILQRHREHHLWPDRRVWELPELAPAYVLPPGRIDRPTREQALQCLTPLRTTSS